MSADELVQQKVSELKAKGVSEEMLKGYIADALEFAFIKTLAPRIESLSEEEYQNAAAAITEDRIDAVTKQLFGESNPMVNDLDHRIFASHLKQAFDME